MLKPVRAAPACAHADEAGERVDGQDERERERGERGQSQPSRPVVLLFARGPIDRRRSAVKSGSHLPIREPVEGGGRDT